MHFGATQIRLVLGAAVFSLCVACDPGTIKSSGDGPPPIQNPDAGGVAADSGVGADSALLADGGAEAGLSDSGLTDAAPKPQRTFLTKLDSKMRKQANSTAGVVKLVRRGQFVKDLTPRQELNKYVKVKFLSKQGWIKRDRLKYIPPGTKPLDVAILYPNGFFKRQAYHQVWNPTGPSSSGNCSVASLAMAAMILGKEPANMDVEASIDRVRIMMNKATDAGSASLDQVRLGASKLKLKYVAMSTGGLDTQLGKRRMVVLAGEPGKPGSSVSTVYQKAFISAGYNYTYTGHHSILVIAKLASGKYLVGDPLSRIGTIQLTKAQMKDFWARWGGMGTSVWL